MVSNVELPAVITHSLLKTFQRCPREALYKYVELLTPRQKHSQPLERGSWFHELLEAKYKAQAGIETDGVLEVHNAKCDEYGDLMDEEKE